MYNDFNNIFVYSGVEIWNSLRSLQYG
jgi:hypothetical protein